jgi:hypothetical protein
MAFHYEMLLEAFGPVHSWRAWAFERFNYTLQNIKTNSRFGEKHPFDFPFTSLNSPMLTGEMEMTFINDACRAANLPALLSSNRLPDTMTSLWPEYQKTFCSDIRGTRLNDSLAFGSSGRLKVTYLSSKPKGKFAELQKYFAKGITTLTGIHHSGILPSPLVAAL